MAKRQIILMKVASSASADDHDDAVQPLGDRKEVLAALADFNTAPDSTGGEFLYGPGLVMQMPFAGDEIAQLLVSHTDEDFAWPVLFRICERLGWNLMDPNSGRVLTLS